MGDCHTIHVDAADDRGVLTQLQTMKKHLVLIFFDLPDGRSLVFNGYVTTNNIVVSKLFKKVFGFELPENTEISYG